MISRDSMVSLLLFLIRQNECSLASFFYIFFSWTPRRDSPQLYSGQGRPNVMSCFLYTPNNGREIWIVFVKSIILVHQKAASLLSSIETLMTSRILFSSSMLVLKLNSAQSVFFKCFLNEVWRYRFRVQVAVVNGQVFFSAWRSRGGRDEQRMTCLMNSAI